MFHILSKNSIGLFANNHASYAYYRLSSLYPCFFSTSKPKNLVISPAILDLLLHKYQFSPQVASSVLNRVKDTRNSVSILSFLKDSGFSNDQLQKMVNRMPAILSASLENRIKPNLRDLQHLGFLSKDIAKITSSNPSVLISNLNTRVIPSVSMLKGLLGTKDAVAKLWTRAPWFLTCDLDSKMVPNVEFLKSCGVPMECIRKLFKYPRCLLVKPEIIRKSVEKAEEMGVSGRSEMFISAVRVISTQFGKTWEVKLQVLRSCGFSESDIMKMFVRAPCVFAGSTEKLKRVTDVLLATGNYSLSCIVKYPISLGCSVEKRYQPRFQILEILENKSLIKKWPCLGKLYMLSDEEFFEKFVGPYSGEVGKVYVAKSSANQKIGLKEL